ncbi:MAG: OmpA family protein [Saprospiraceae bacterium]|nr:OmpA family protein [Saprospiraceae bacterium]
MPFTSKYHRVLWAVLLPAMLSAQQKTDLIHFANPSFEDLPKCCEAPSGWYNCGKSEESPPDIQPGSFQVTKTPSNGETYLGLVVRDNETWEGVAQRISQPLEMNECYEFSLDLCRAELYLSLSRTTGEEVNYATPAKIRIWGGMGYCEKRELLWETPLITTTRWLTYTFRISPKKGTYSFIFIESYFKTPSLFAYNGNILVDNASPIKRIECNMMNMPENEPNTQPLADAGKPPMTRTPKAPTKTNEIKRPETPKPSATASAPAKINRASLKKGSIVRLDKVYFDADKYIIREESVPALMEVYTFLSENPDVILEIGGHTNNRPTEEFAQTLSTSRAKSVAEWLISKGITAERVQYRGYGKKFPIETNATVDGRKRNQRVEIKILSMNG